MAYWTRLLNEWGDKPPPRVRLPSSPLESKPNRSMCMKRKKRPSEDDIISIVVARWLADSDFQAGMRRYAPPRLLAEIDGCDYHIDTAFVMRAHLGASMVPGELNYWQKTQPKESWIAKSKTAKEIAKEVLDAWMCELGDLHHKCCVQVSDENWTIKPCGKSAVLALGHNSRTTYICLAHAPQVFMELMDAANNRIAKLFD